MLVHDRSLRLRQELLDAVTAAAGFALANERALHDAQLAEQRNRALLDAIPDTMLRVASDGTYLDIRPDEHTGQLGPAEEMIGRNVRDLLPDELATTVLACIERTLESGGVNTIEYELPIRGVAPLEGGTDGSERRRRGRGDRPVTSPGSGAPRRSSSDWRRSRRRCAASRPSSRETPPPEQVFQTVTEEVCRLVGLRTAVLHRFEDARTSTIVGKFGEPTGPYELGNTNELEVGSALQVLRTGAPARSNYDGLVGSGAVMLRTLGFHGSMGVPITVAGVTWGALVVALRAGESLPLETERRLQAFAELVGLAVASAHARDELSASRLRIVEASDAERRRIERNLHDGAQQRLVALSVGLRLAQAKLKCAPDEAGELLADASEELVEALTELRELAQGIHPARPDGAWSRSSAGCARRAGAAAGRPRRDAARAPAGAGGGGRLLRRSPRRSRTSSSTPPPAPPWCGRSASTGARWSRSWTTAIGGADLDRGSGLYGLRDRVETLDGKLRVESELGIGTRVRAELPVPAWERSTESERRR